MTFKSKRTVEEIFAAAVERDPQDRAAYLNKACAGDSLLRSEVESLIRYYEQSNSLVATPIISNSTEALADQPTVALPEDYRHEERQLDYSPDRQLGPYKLLREIGRGGMGAVYLAARADDQFEKTVAIKVIKRGMDSDFVLRRFRNERQILASLDHPNIARLLDGGTTPDGLPYFVMEYVKGVPISVYCDQHRLSTAERLKLFRAVCSAVQYAHQNLIVHRDIKPGNILVTDDGTPKLLDFGIAKLLNPELSPYTVDRTASAVRLMTPDYASPEQVRGEPITTASDVYSLGVLLYELLTGHKPYRITSYHQQEMVRIICEQEPEKPSTAVNRVEQVTKAGETNPSTITPEIVSRTRDGHPDKLRRHLAGDLDNIVLMAMRKEPQRRYSSVEQFSEDIRRHLEGLPVIARKDTFGYRSGKFFRRHRAAVVAAGLIFLTLVVAVVVTAWQAYIARTERARAERRFNDVRKLANSIMFELHDSIENLAGSTPARELLVKRALEYLDSLAQESASDLSLQRELAQAYLKVGDVQGYPYDANLGDTAGALDSYRKAQAISEAIVQQDPADNDSRRQLLVSYERVGDTLAATGDMAGALENHSKALSISEQLAATDPANNKLRRTWLVGHIKVGEVLSETGRINEALEIYLKARDIVEALVASEPENAAYRRDLTIVYNKLSDVRLATGDAAGALEGYRKVLAIREAIAAEDPNNGEALRDVAVSHEKIAEALAVTGDVKGALESQLKALAIDEKLVAADPANAEAQMGLAYSLSNIGKARAMAGDTKEALAAYYKAQAIFEKLASNDPANAEVRIDIGDNYFQIGHLLAKSGDLSGAAASYNKAASLCEPVANADPTNAEFRSNLAGWYSETGATFASLAANQAAYWRDARMWYQRGLDLYKDLLARGILKEQDKAKIGHLEGEIAKAEAALSGGK